MYTDCAVIFFKRKAVCIRTTYISQGSTWSTGSTDFLQTKTACILFGFLRQPSKYSLVTDWISLISAGWIQLTGLFILTAFRQSDVSIVYSPIKETSSRKTAELVKRIRSENEAGVERLSLRHSYKKDKDRYTVDCGKSNNTTSNLIQFDYCTYPNTFPFMIMLHPSFNVYLTALFSSFSVLSEQSSAKRFSLQLIPPQEKGACTTLLLISLETQPNAQSETVVIFLAAVVSRFAEERNRQMIANRRIRIKKVG